MEASPQVGDLYCQENAPGVAQDVAEVLSVTASRSVPAGMYSGNVLQTKDYSLLEVFDDPFLAQQVRRSASTLAEGNPLPSFRGDPAARLEERLSIIANTPPGRWLKRVGGRCAGDLGELRKSGASKGTGATEACRDGPDLL